MGIINISDYDNTETKNIHMKRVCFEEGREANYYQWYASSGELPESSSEDYDEEYDKYIWTDLGPATEEEMKVLKKFKVIEE